MTDSYNIYCGAGDAANIDWSQPVATISASSPSLRLSLQEGRIYVLGVRRVSAAGVEEQSCHSLAYVRVDAGGRLVPVLLPASGVSVRRLGGSQASLSFRYELPPGLKAPDAFEIISDHGTGTFDTDEPVLILRPAASARGQSRFCANVELEHAGEQFCVRARLRSHYGPLSAPARPAAMMAAPVVLEEKLS